jgi:hypothetical protein
MPLQFFGGSGSARVNVGAGAGLGNLHTGTFAAWVMANATTGSRIWEKGVTTSAQTFALFATGPIFANARGTQSQTAIAPTSNFAAYALNIPLFFAATFNDAGAAADQKLYMGNLQMPATEPSAYSVQRVGSGAFGDNSAADGFIGNLAATNRAFPGLIWSLGIWTRVLSRDELIAQQDGSRPGGCEAFWRPGTNGRGGVLDESGNNHHGTITGAVPTNDYLPRVWTPAA